MPTWTVWIWLPTSSRWWNAAPAKQAASHSREGRSDAAAGCGEQIAAGHPPGIDDIEPVHRGGGIEHEQLLHLPRGERLLGRPAGEELRAETRVRKLCGRAKEERAERVEVVLRGRNELLGEPGGAVGERAAGDQRVDRLVVCGRGQRGGAENDREAAHRSSLPQPIEERAQPGQPIPALRPVPG